MFQIIYWPIKIVVNTQFNPLNKNLTFSLSMYRSSEILLFLDPEFDFSKIDMLNSSFFMLYIIIGLSMILLIRNYKRNSTPSNKYRAGTERMRSIIENYKKEVLSMHTSSFQSSFTTENINIKSSLNFESSQESARDKNNEKNLNAKKLQNELKVSISRKPRSFIKKFLLCIKLGI